MPYDWLLQKSRDAVDEYDIYEKVAKQTAYNPRFTVEQCYVAGLDPESTTNEFKMAISMEGGFPTVTWDPDLGILREYKVWGARVAYERRLGLPDQFHAPFLQGHGRNAVIGLLRECFRSEIR